MLLEETRPPRIAGVGEAVLGDEERKADAGRTPEHRRRRAWPTAAGPGSPTTAGESSRTSSLDTDGACDGRVKFAEGTSGLYTAFISVRETLGAMTSEKEREKRGGPKARAEAKRRVLEYVNQMYQVPGDVLDVVDEATLETPTAWIFFYSSRRAIRAGEFHRDAYPNAPILVKKSTGALEPILPPTTVRDLAGEIPPFRSRRKRS